MWVKICGLTNLQDAQAAAEAGADALGFIFVRSSPRYLPARSPDWGEWLIGLRGGRSLVAVLNQPDELPSNWQRFDAVQWVAPEGVLPHSDSLRWLPDLPLWMALRLPDSLTVDDALRILERWSPYVERFVLDTYHPQQLGGTGATHDWERTAALCARVSKPIVLAGGLTPENVAAAVRTVRPAGVDVSSGVEAHLGRKDPQRVREFIRQARCAWGGEVD
ncbi:MAG: phosphoribosylanthranilate isomerase [Fimbriimonadales bacterium]